MNLLGIETATDVCSVALLSDDDAVAEIHLMRPRSHAEMLVPMIEHVLRLAHLSPGDVEVVAVSIGPGSYTGLRIGVSAAKGFAFGVGAQILGVPSLDALALNVSRNADEGDHLIPAHAARGDEVYAGLWRVGREVQPDGGGSWAGEGGVTLELVRETEALSVSDAVEWLAALGPGRIWLAGSGGQAIVTASRGAATEGADLRVSNVHPSAAGVARLGLKMLRGGTNHDVASLEPLYLKEFIAKKQQRSIFERLPF